MDALAPAKQALEQAVQQTERGLTQPQCEQRANQNPGEHPQAHTCTEDLRSADAPVHRVSYCKRTIGVAAAHNCSRS